MSLLDNVHGYLGQSEVSQISQHLGIDPQLAQTAIAAALPMIVAGMASHAAQPDGAVTVDQEADKHIDVANDVGAVLQAGPPVDNTGLLGRIFGQHHATVQQSVQQASGLDADKVKKLLLMLSPIVLSALARRTFGGQQQPGSQTTSGTLQQEAQDARQRVQHLPGLGGLLGQILGKL